MAASMYRHSSPGTQKAMGCTGMPFSSLTFSSYLCHTYHILCMLIVIHRSNPSAR